MRELARDGIASKGSITYAILGLFQKPTSRLFICIELSKKVSFMLIAPS